MDTFHPAGLGVFGVMPATAALFAIARKWLMKEEFPLWATFLHHFKKEFKTSNLAGLLLVVCGILLYTDYHFLLSASGAVRITAAALLLLFLFCYILTVLFFFPVFVHYELGLCGYIKTAFLIGMMNLHAAFFMAVGLGALIYLQISYPGFSPFFGAVSPAILIMIGGQHGFNRMKRLQLSRTAPGHR
ncbi:DUF624 domain-containing protein [Fictibacillus sp. NE201]|uniref:DUF624 domain-containing protein n=2 Tax=Fictibacillus fluitans TaxID=3058422 RepID=A0ABT8HY30_9BACL|nr:DUF624 domain-containing protein [Fictibacillus sp. NE201]MDN4525688.1 DUF624 domain-containing protein [Fictibacillus sp. NE201]